MINKPPPFKGLNIRIPIIIPIKGRGFVNHGLGLLPGQSAHNHEGAQSARAQSRREGRGLEKSACHVAEP